MTETRVAYIVAAVRLVVAALAFGVVAAADGPTQPEPINAPVWGTLGLADGIPANQHRMLQPQAGVVLGCWWTADDRSHPTACYWLVGTGERVDLAEPVEVGGVAHTPRYPRPGVDPVSGAAVFECWSDDQRMAYATLTIPEAVKTADFNGDGTVDTRDVTAFLNAWGEQREP